MVIDLQTTQSSEDYQTFYQNLTGEQLRGMTDSNLSWGARLLWLKITEMPENSQFTIEDLQDFSAETTGEYTAECYQELLDAGYIEE